MLFAEKTRFSPLQLSIQQIGLSQSKSTEQLHFCSQTRCILHLYLCDPTVHASRNLYAVQYALLLNSFFIERPSSLINFFFSPKNVVLYFDNKGGGCRTHTSTPQRILFAIVLGQETTHENVSCACRVNHGWRTARGHSIDSPLNRKHGAIDTQCYNYSRNSKIVDSFYCWVKIWTSRQSNNSSCEDL